MLWTRRGTQGSIWHWAWATLPATGQQRYQVRTRAPVSLAPARHRVSDTAVWWQVAFEVLNDGFLGDVGLDDITQTAGPCGAELSCSFEAEGCGLVASRKGTWQRQSNGTGTTAGPVADHTTGTAAGMGPWQPCCFPAALSVLPACFECPVCTPHTLPALPLSCLPCPPRPPQDEQKAMLHRASQPWNSPNAISQPQGSLISGGSQAGETP